MRENKTVDRLVSFTDAVVAIAITLLVLPLADLVPEALAKHETPFEAIAQNQWKVYSFLLSFAVIARLWVAHHSLFEHVRSYSRGLMVWNLLWLLTIVTLPFPTNMVGGFGADRFVAGLYIGAILASNVCQLAMVLIIRGNPGTTGDPRDVSGSALFTAVSSVVTLVVALALALLVPGVTYYGLLLLLLPTAYGLLRRGRPDASEPATIPGTTNFFDATR